jgi:catechol 2,3-dioxygenase-like lactoylglutathione lyase family enzyme
MATKTAPDIAGYSHVGIDVTDLAAAKHFYCDILGFEELRRPDFGFPGLWLRVGQLQLHLIETAERPPKGKGLPHFALHVPTDSFATTVDTLRAAGVTLLGDPSSRVDFGRTVWAVFITDPSGNIIELTDVGPLSA